MATYVVTVQSPGGGSTKKITVEATSPDQSKAAAESIGNAEPKASGSPYAYKAISMR